VKSIVLHGLALLLNATGCVYVVDGVVCGCLRGLGYSIGPLGDGGYAAYVTATSG